MVKLIEFDDRETVVFDNNIPFNIADDLMIYMRNDPMFYRRHFFPILDELQGTPSRDSRIRLGKFIDFALENYCKKFNITTPMQQILDATDKDSIINAIYAEDLKG